MHVSVPEPKSKCCTSKHRAPKPTPPPKETVASTGDSEQAEVAPATASPEVPFFGSLVSKRLPHSKAPAKPPSTSKSPRSGPRNSVDKGKAPMDASKASYSTVPPKKRSAEAFYSPVPPLSHFHSEAGRDLFYTTIVNKRIVY